MRRRSSSAYSEMESCCFPFTRRLKAWLDQCSISSAGKTQMPREERGKLLQYFPLLYSCTQPFSALALCGPHVVLRYVVTLRRPLAEPLLAFSSAMSLWEGVAQAHHLSREGHLGLLLSASSLSWLERPGKLKSFSAWRSSLSLFTITSKLEPFVLQ